MHNIYMIYIYSICEHENVYVCACKKYSINWMEIVCQWSFRLPNILSADFLWLMLTNTISSFKF